MANPRISSQRIGDDDLESPRFGTRVLHDHPCSSTVECLAHKDVPVIPRLWFSNCDEHLARLEPAMIVAATSDFPIRAAYEGGLWKQSPQAYRGNSPLR